MYNLNNAFHSCLDMVVNAGINPGKIVEVIPNTRAKSRWGQCKRVNGGYSININVICWMKETTTRGWRILLSMKYCTL